MKTIIYYKLEMGKLNSFTKNFREKTALKYILQKTTGMDLYNR